MHFSKSPTAVSFLSGLLVASDVVRLALNYFSQNAHLMNSPEELSPMFTIASSASHETLSHAIVRQVSNMGHALGGSGESSRKGKVCYVFVLYVCACGACGLSLSLSKTHPRTLLLSL